MKNYQRRLQRNANLPVYRLSPDVLISIFFFLRDDSLQSWTLRGWPYAGWTWVTVTKTCKLWRDLAIECSSLWTDVFTCSPSGTLRVFLERSGQLEINVYLDRFISLGNPNSITPLLKSHMWRASSLIGNTSELGSFNVTALMHALTERCKTVSLEFVPSKDDPVFEDIGDLDPKIQLKSLSLYAVPLRWSSSLFHGLTELSIMDRYNPTRINPNILQFRNILEHCPNLRFLKLDHVYPTMNPGEEIQEPSLPHLERVQWDHLPYSIISYLFKICGVKDNVKVDATFDEYFIEDLEILPEDVLRGRKRCDTLCMDIGYEKISLRSNPVHNGTCMISDTAISINVFEDPNDLPLTSVEIMNSINVLLQDPFWKTADEILVSFFGFEPRRAKSCMDTSSWGILLDVLPKHAKTLIIEIPFKKYERNAPIRAGSVGSAAKESCYTIFKGLPEALSEIVGETGARLPELEQLTILYEDLTNEEEAAQCRGLLLRQLEERAARTSRVCSVDFRRNVADRIGVPPLAFTLNRV